MVDMNSVMRKGTNIAMFLMNMVNQWRTECFFFQEILLTSFAGHAHKNAHDEKEYYVFRRRSQLEAVKGNCCYYVCTQVIRV